MKRHVFFALFGATLTVAAIAQTSTAPKAVPSPAQPAAKAQRGDVRIRNAKDGSAVYDNRRGISRITKNVVVTQEGEDFILRAEEIVYNENTNEAIGRGNLDIQSRDSTIVGDAIRADFDRKVITITGRVTMNTHGKGDGIRSARDPKRKPSQITCDRVDYNYENRQAIVTGGIRISQENNVGTCERILFDEDRNYAQLQGAVTFRNTQSGQTIKSTDIEVWIDDNVVKASNRTTVTSPDKRTPRAPAPRTTIPPPAALPDDLGDQFGRPIPPPPAPAPPVQEAEEPSARATTAPTSETDKR